MSTKENDVLENLIEDNIDKLQEVHAEGYVGTGDDMPDAFDNWVSGLTIEEVEGYIK